MEKILRENKDKIPEAEAEAVRREIDTTKKAIASEDVEQIKRAVENLHQASHKLTEQMYQQASAQAPGAGPAGSQEGKPGGGNGRPPRKRRHRRGSRGRRQEKPR